MQRLEMQRFEMQRSGVLLDGWEREVARKHRYGWSWRRADGRGRRGPTWLGDLRQRGSDLGMATAEVAILILVTCGFAALLSAVLRSSEVRGLLTGLVRDALSTR